jgi:hypothetical protein
MAMNSERATCSGKASGEPCGGPALRDGTSGGCFWHDESTRHLREDTALDRGEGPVPAPLLELGDLDLQTSQGVQGALQQLFVALATTPLVDTRRARVVVAAGQALMRAAQFRETKADLATARREIRRLQKENHRLGEENQWLQKEADRLGREVRWIQEESRRALRDRERLLAQGVAAQGDAGTGGRRAMNT